MNLAAEPKIIGLANSLKLTSGDPVEHIRNFCKQRVEKLLRGTKGPLTMELLERTICKKLNLKVHRVWTDSELNELSSEYVEKGEVVFATLQGQLTPDAYGIFIRLISPNENGEKWVTIIDCRGDKASKRHWTLWHEIAHCLTAVDQMHLPLRRTIVKRKDPIEVITDIVASDFAFYAPVFEPIHEKVMRHHNGELTFNAVAEIQDCFYPEASFSATLNACIARANTPSMILRAEYGYSKNEIAKIEAGDETIEPKLRVTSAISNALAKESGIFIPFNYRIPIDSVIALAHKADWRDSSGGMKSVENLGEWSDSSGRSLKNMNISIEAKKMGDGVMALIQES
jgi:hypothetical protein